MNDPRSEQDEAKAQPIVHSGPGALCPEAQADGVPCEELGVDCEDCEKAQPTAVEPSKRRADLT